MLVVNLTPHQITLVGEGNSVLLVIPASGSLARVTVSSTKVGEIVSEGIVVDVFQSVYGQVEGLPEPQAGTVYIVSALVASRCPGRDDVLIPDDAVRDESGRIIGCRRFGRV